MRDGGAGTSLLTGRRRRRLRDEPPYGTSLLRGGTHGRASLRTNLLYGPEALTGRLLNAYGTGRRRWRDKPPYEPEAEAYGTEALGRASLRAGGGGAYGTSLLTGRASCTEALMDEPPYERIFFTGRRRLRDASLMLTGRAGDAGLWDGGAGTSLLAGGGGAYGMSLTGRSADYGRRLRDELLRDDPAYGTEAEALAGLASLYTSAYGTSPITGRRRLRGGGGLRDTGRASLRDSLLTGRRHLRHESFEPPYGTSLLARRHSRTNLLTKRRRFFTGRRRLRDASLRAEALTGRASLQDGALITGGA